MRINKRLVYKSTKRQPGDPKRKLEMLTKQHGFFKNFKKTIFPCNTE